jgi:tetratricopeptide (TPR) repeat protein
MVIAGTISCTTSPEIYNQQGNQHLLQGEIEPAIAAFQSAQVLDPDNSIYYFNAASAYQLAGNTLASQQALIETIERGDDLIIAAAWYNLGNLYFQQELYAEAIDAYQQSLRADSSNADARYNLELALAQLLAPTPTAIEMQTNPENDAADPTQPPTPNPDGQTIPTPTPPPDAAPPGPSPMFQGEDENGEEDENSISTPMPRSEGELDVETAAEILDPIEANQEKLSTFRENYDLQATPSTERDW